MKLVLIFLNLPCQNSREFAHAHSFSVDTIYDRVNQLIKTKLSFSKSKQQRRKLYKSLYPFDEKISNKLDEAVLRFERIYALIFDNSSSNLADTLPRHQT